MFGYLLTPLVELAKFHDEAVGHGGKDEHRQSVDDDVVEYAGVD